jgi:hypothetical protein
MPSHPICKSAVIKDGGARACAETHELRSRQKRKHMERCVLRGEEAPQHQAAHLGILAPMNVLVLGLRARDGVSTTLWQPKPSYQLGMSSLSGILRLFFLPGGLVHKQGPRRARLRAAPLPHAHNTPVVTSCFLQEGQVREQEAYTQQGRAHIRRLHPDWAARPALMSRAAHAGN